MATCCSACTSAKTARASRQQHRASAAGTTSLRTRTATSSEFLWGNAVPGFPGGELFELVLDYGEHDEAAPTPAEERPWQLRPDPRSARRTGFELRTRRLCRRVLLFGRISELGPQPVLLRSHRLDYDATPERSLLTEIELTGYRDGVAATLPSLAFGYATGLNPWPVRDITDERTAAVADIERSEWIDLNGDGLPGLLQRDRLGALTYRENRGDGQLAAPLALSSRPATTQKARFERSVLAQPFGDAHACVVELARVPGFHDRDLIGRWSAFATFGSARGDVTSHVTIHAVINTERQRTCTAPTGSGPGRPPGKPSPASSPTTSSTTTGNGSTTTAASAHWSPNSRTSPSPSPTPPGNASAAPPPPNAQTPQKPHNPVVALRLTRENLPCQHAFPQVSSKCEDLTNADLGKRSSV